jgi:hypothetical protein
MAMAVATGHLASLFFGLWALRSGAVGSLVGVPGWVEVVIGVSMLASAFTLAFAVALLRWARQRGLSRVQLLHLCGVLLGGILMTFEYLFWRIWVWP